MYLAVTHDGRLAESTAGLLAPSPPLAVREVSPDNRHNRASRPHPDNMVQVADSSNRPIIVRWFVRIVRNKPVDPLCSPPDIARIHRGKVKLGTDGKLDVG